MIDNDENKQSNTTRTILIVVGVIALLCCCFLLIVFVLPVLFGPEIGDVFSDINRALEATPSSP